MTRRAETIVSALFLTAAMCSRGYGQAPPATIIQIETDNQVRYVWDTPDYSTYAKTPTPSNLVLPTFATYMTQGDIVAVNGKPAKGMYITRQVVTNLSPTPQPGQGIADFTATAMVDRIIVLMQADGTPVGSITMLGLDGAVPPPGAPAMSRQGSFAISGGTGAYLGVRGQFESGPLIPGAPGARSGSVKEDPSLRRINGGMRGIFLLHLIPMAVPQVVSTPNGPAVSHSSDFSLVTAAKPAAAGEVLSIYATGLGPTNQILDPGKPFPANPLALVNSPVEVTVNGRPAELLVAVGYPGTVDNYRVDFRVPTDTAKGLATLQLTAAWIAGSEVRFAVQ
jgi:hypothetical protein